MAPRPGRDPHRPSAGVRSDFDREVNAYRAAYYTRGPITRIGKIELRAISPR